MNNNDKNYRYVLYARKSTEGQDKQAQSIPDQIRIMSDFAKKQGLKVVATYSEAVSGGETNRTEFAKAMQMIEDGDADAFLCWDINRLSRNPKNSGEIHQLMIDGKLKVIKTYTRTYTDDDDLIFDVESSMNARFRKDLAKNVKRGMYSKAEKGEFPGRPCVGYINDRNQRCIIVDPDSGDKIKELFIKFAYTNISIAELTRYADEELRLKTHQTKRSGGKPLVVNSIRKMLSNPFYLGKLKWGGKYYDGSHTPLVDQRTFDKVQERLQDLSHNTRPKMTEPYPFLFRGMIKCGECGYAIISEKKHKHLKDGTTKEYTYCHCSGKSKTHHCSQKSVNIPEEELAAQIKKELQKYTIDEDYYRLAVEALQEEEDSRVEKQKKTIMEINKEVLKLNTELSNLRRMRYRGEISDDAWFIEESQSLEKDIKFQEDRRTAVNLAAKDWRSIADDIFMFARYAKEDFDKGTLEQKQHVLKTLGAEFKLVGRTIVFTPCKYLVPIKKAVVETARLEEMGRTEILQGSNTQNNALNELWYTLRDSNPR